MKSGIIKLILASCICVLLWYIPVVYGNPVFIYDNTNYEAISFTIGALITLIIFTILIELGVLYIYFRKYIVEGRCSLKFTKSIITVNLFTFPMTQIIGLLLSALSIQIFLLLLITESIPISIEYVLYRKIFDGFHRSNDFFTPIPRKRVTSSTILANSITFSLGIFIFLPQIILIAFK